MYKKWSERSTMEKVLEVVSAGALCVAIICMILANTTKLKLPGEINNIAMCITCICQAYVYRNSQNRLSLGFVIAALFLGSTVILSFFA